MQKILFLNETSNIGGAENSLLALITNLNQEKYYPIFVSPSNGELVNRLRKYSIDCRILKIYPFKPNVNLKIKIMDNIGNYTMYAFRLLYSAIIISVFIKKNNINIVHTNSNKVAFWIAPIAAIITNKPFIWNLRNIGIKKRKCYKIITKYISKFAKKVVVVSHALKKELNYIDVDKIEVIYNGISSSNQEYIDNPNKIAMVGHISKTKGQLTLVKSIRHLVKDFPNVECHFLGHVKDNDYYEDIVKYIAKYNLQSHCIFKGYVDNVISYLKSNIGIFVFTSVEFDALPRSILEAMSLKKTLVASKIGGVPEIITDGVNGLLYEAGNEYELTDKLKIVLKNDRLRKEFAQAGFENIKTKFNISSYVNNFERIYNELSIIAS